MDKDTKRLLGRLLGEVFRIQKSLLTWPVKQAMPKFMGFLMVRGFSKMKSAEERRYQHRKGEGRDGCA